MIGEAGVLVGAVTVVLLLAGAFVEIETLCSSCESLAFGTGNIIALSAVGVPSLTWWTVIVSRGGIIWTLAWSVFPSIGRVYGTGAKRTEDCRRTRRYGQHVLCPVCLVAEPA